jgi:hypothetical protein
MAWRDLQTGEYVAPLASIRAASKEQAVEEALRRLGGPPEPYRVRRVEAGPDTGMEGVLRLRDVEPASEGGGADYFVRVVLEMPPGHVPLVERVREVLARRPPRVELRVHEIEGFGELLAGGVEVLDLCTSDFVRLESKGHFGVVTELRGEVRVAAGSREPDPAHARFLSTAHDLEAALAALDDWIAGHDGDACGRAAWAEGASWEELRGKFAALCGIQAFEEAARVAERAFEVAQGVFGSGHPRFAGVLKEFAREYELAGRVDRSEQLKKRAREIIGKQLHG